MHLGTLAHTRVAPLVVLVGFALIAGSASVWSTPDPAIADCDRLAASPNDAVAGRAGVAFENLDGERAQEACRKARGVDPGNARLAFQLGRAQQKLGNYTEALALFEEARSGDYRLADVAIGILYDHGLGVPQDYGRALEHYNRAAEAGIGVGLSNVADFYAEGLGVEQDDAKALALFQKAAGAGYAPAYGKIANLLADTHMQGDDTRPVIDAYLAAAAQGIGFADSELGQFYRDGRFGLPADPLAARAHFEAAITAGDEWAALHLAELLVFGRDRARRDRARAAELLAGSAETGAPPLRATALALLAEIALQRKGEEKQAASLIDQALALQPENAVAHAALAELLLRTRDFQGADAALAKAIEAAPDWAPYHLRRAGVQDELHQAEAAATLRASADKAAQGAGLLPR
ncbi:tetratricopeptide repeat protein [Ancylobacter rudongensis]|uniref:TPR repeat n=1 Tax=Ancylobacter rudongensis TaxID=177413 RepID=A0A1G4TK19_9HYPH|nr:tetratricopeptide repeat protein [Ancylobacter rudongensis]SCW81706.1 TPR repeat [Ancylobacter rudongensis]